MSIAPVIRVEGVSKRFKLYTNPWHRMLEWATGSVFQKHVPIWALKDISFTVDQGRCLGIIGRNGAGKSTLLKILSGVLQVTGGKYTVQGRVLSLLDLEAGLNQELSGRQNAYNSARLLALPVGYLENRIEEIEAFAELGDFFDRPVKTYSTGMRLKLVFSLFSHLEPDVLIIDEALSVGDIFFRQKCHKRVEALLANNTTAIIATHDMDAVRKYCHTAIVIEKGRVAFIGSPSEAISAYSLRRHFDSSVLSSAGTEKGRAQLCKDNQGDAVESSISFWPPKETFVEPDADPGSKLEWVRCTGVALCDGEGNPCGVLQYGQTAYFHYEFQALRDLPVPVGTLTISSDKNLLVHGKSSLQLLVKPTVGVAKGRFVRFRQSVDLNLALGEYTFGVALMVIGLEDYTRAESLSWEELQAKRVKLMRIDRAGTFRVVSRVGNGLQVEHHGLCDLPGRIEVGLA